MSNEKFKHLLRPGRVGDLALSNSMLMSPMTRFRVTEQGVVTPLNNIYYGQRASAGLIITEATYPEPRGRSGPRTAGIYTDEQVAAWSSVVADVHRNGGKIFCQLAHGGRVSHPALQPEGGDPVAPSAIAKVGEVRIVEKDDEEVVKVEAPVPRALETAEVAEVVQQYKQAAERAMRAGFDGVELHASSGTLPQQFLSTCCNTRTDRYGGSAAARSRFVVEVLEAMSEVRGPGRVGVKLGPNFAYQGITMDGADMIETYTCLARALSPLNLGYVHVQYPPWGLFIGPSDFNPIDFIRGVYKGTLVGAGEFDRHSGEAMLASGRCDLISFGRRFIANPDLPERIRRDAPENGWDETTLYTPNSAGFTDYPTLAEADLG